MVIQPPLSATWTKLHTGIQHQEWDSKKNSEQERDTLFRKISFYHTRQLENVSHFKISVQATRNISLLIGTSRNRE